MKIKHLHLIIVVIVLCSSFSLEVNSCCNKPKLKIIYLHVFQLIQNPVLDLLWYYLAIHIC